MKAIFGNDRPLLYDVAPWNELGFAVPNFGRQIGTLNAPIWGLADEISKAQLLIMTHRDAQRTQFPSRNTIERLGKLFNRVQTVLAARQKKSTDMRLEEGHATADLKPWQIHPVPFFVSEMVQNRWLNEYNRLCVIAMTNIYQHSDNNLALTVTEAFATEIFQYFREIAILLGVELLGLPIETVEADGFVFTKEHYEGYATIAERVLSFEALDSPGPIQSLATEVDLNPLFIGFPSTMVVSSLKQYPVDVSSGLGFQGAELPEEAAAPGTTDGSQVSAPGGSIGNPQV